MRSRLNTAVNAVVGIRATLPAHVAVFSLDAVSDKEMPYSAQLPGVAFVTHYFYW